MLRKSITYHQHLVASQRMLHGHLALEPEGTASVRSCLYGAREAATIVLLYLGIGVAGAALLHPSECAELVIALLR